MPHRRLARVPVPPGPAGVEAVWRALRIALDGGPALAPVPVVSVTVSTDHVGSVLDALRPDDPRHPLESDDAVAVVATSGSTGDPRGVLLTAEALLTVARGPAGRTTDGVHHLVALPVTSVGGLQVVVRALVAGVPPTALASVGGAEPFSPSGFVAATAALLDRAAGAAVRTSLVPAQLRRLLGDGAARAALAGYDEVLLGGAAASTALLADAAAAGVRVVRTYGMTETAGGCVYDGVPLPGVVARVVAGPGDQGSGDRGEVVLAGPVVALGYRLRPRETAARFGLGDAGREFRTGDVGELGTDGRLVVVGRLDDVVQVRGTNVAVGAVEGAVAALDGVAEACVVAVDGGDDGSRLVAFVVPAGGRSGSPGSPTDRSEAVRSGVRAALGPAAVPREVHELDSLPLLPGGKIDRATLRRRAAGH